MAIMYSCPRCEIKLCRCGEEGEWGETLISDETYDICPACKNTEPELPEPTTLDPCHICNYPLEFDIDKAMATTAEDIGDLINAGEITLIQGVAALNNAKAEFLKRRS